MVLDIFNFTIRCSIFRLFTLKFEALIFTHGQYQLCHYTDMVSLYWHGVIILTWCHYTDMVLSCTGFLCVDSFLRQHNREMVFQLFYTKIQLNIINTVINTNSLLTLVRLQFVNTHRLGGVNMTLPTMQS